MIKKILVALYLGFLTTLAYATIYSYVDNNGTTYYTNERPLGLTTAERAQFSSVFTTLIDAMTVNADVILSDRERVKGILRLDNTPPPVVVEPEPIPEPTPEPTPVEPTPTPVEPPHDHGNMPMVDASKNMVPAVGFDTSRIRQTSQTTAVSGGGGDFRVQCDASHMGVFDPIVFFGQDGKPHHHTFWGNTGTNAFSTPESLMNSGNSTCKGGIANRSAYWIPSLIDTRTNAPVKPKFALFYYKNGRDPIPNGLVILAGDMSSNPNKQQATGWTPEVIRWQCGDTWVGRKNHIPACSGELNAMINFPTCWDGLRLDSPDHKAHMAYPDNGVCPSGYPKKIPDIAFNIKWDVDNSAHYRLSSDNYVGDAGGYSLHADYMFAWDESVLNQWFQGCIVGKRDCHANLLGNGFELY